MRRALAPLCLCLALLLAACGRQDADARPTAEPLPAPTAAPLSGYEELPVYYDGLLRLRGYGVEDTLYLGAEDVCALFGLSAAAEGDAAQFRLALESWTLAGAADSSVSAAGSGSSIPSSSPAFFGNAKAPTLYSPFMMP